jgi:hypothetical protein
MAKADGEIEVCGDHWLKVGADGQPAEADVAEMFTRPWTKWHRWRSPR